MNLNKISPGVYYSNENKPVGKDEIKFLEREINKYNLNIARICMHDSLESELMVMLIVIKNGYKYPPHRHAWKDECYTIIEGSCKYIEYSMNGEIINEQILEPGNTFINKNKCYHTLVPNCDKIVFLETTTGPFRAKQLDFL